LLFEATWYGEKGIWKYGLLRVFGLCVGGHFSIAVDLNNYRSI